MKKKCFVSTLLILFVSLSFAFINPLSRPIQSEYRSSDLKQIIKREGNVERTDYLDSHGNITNAADTGYATMIKTRNSKGVLEKYYNKKGVAISRYNGYYAILREYDDMNKNIRNTFLDQDNNACITKDGFAIEEREYNENNQLIIVKYYDAEGEPVCTALYGYGRINEYDENGVNIKTTYIDSLGQPMMTAQGYASVIRQYNSENDSNGKRFDNEFYYDKKGEPVSLSLGQYGVHKEYNELGQGIVSTFLDSKGQPIISTEGYTTIVRTFNIDNSIATEQYYDLEGKPFPLSEGQYGFKKSNGQTIFLNQHGEATFNLRNLLYNKTWIVIPIVIIVLILSCVIGKKLNLLLLVPCIFTIIYLTLMFRENIGYKGIDILHSYRNAFHDSEASMDIIRNIWLFVPLGAIIYQISSKKRILIIPFILSVLIECIQYCTHIGFCELDDVISNTIGSCLGFYVGKVTSQMILRIKKWKHSHSK